jgi:hypothetical protein
MMRMQPRRKWQQHPAWLLNQKFGISFYRNGCQIKIRTMAMERRGRKGGIELKYRVLSWKMQPIHQSVPVPMSISTFLFPPLHELV